ncbi:carboxypeptidase-like regulatory domain-containing protein [Synechococcus sp. R3-13]|uniref:carboxypeptidase-like regulatory domain-containing protein n=1 Tax=Synechococcus sp. R3-13 TaxID=2421316 RepID=UPI0039C152EE
MPLLFFHPLRRRISYRYATLSRTGSLALCGWLALASGALAQAPATPIPRLTPLFPFQDKGQPQGTARLVGQVSNSVGQPVAGAQVQLEGMENPIQPIQTDERGAFELDHAPTGRRMLTVWHPDYEKAEQEILLQAGLTTPVDVVLQVPIRPQPRRRLGILGVGGLEHTQLLGQRLAIEAVRLGLIPNGEKVVPLDNRRIQPILQKVGWPIYELFEWDRRKPEAVGQFFDYLGLEAIVIARVDVLTRPASPTELSLRSRSRLELWRFDEQGNLVVDILAEASRDQVERSNLNAAELAQLYQIQVTQMAAEVGSRWKENHPLAQYLELAQGEAPPPRSRLDTAVELRIPSATPTP